MPPEDPSRLSGPDTVVYLDTRHLSVRWDPAWSHVLAEWREFAESAEFRSGLMAVIRAIRESSVDAYLSDSRRVKVILSADRAWVRETWTPLALEAGLKWIAVVAQVGLAKLIIEELLAELPELRSRTFESMTEAMEWLAEPRR